MRPQARSELQNMHHRERMWKGRPCLLLHLVPYRPIIYTNNLFVLSPKKVPYTPIIKYVISRKARQEKDPKLFCAMNATINV